MHWGTRRVLLGFAFAAFLSAAGESRGAIFSFFNTNFITINDSANPPTQATLYPSSLNVTGLAGQTVTKVTVTLTGLSHTYPSDINVLLVGPQGQTAILMSETGGIQKHSVTNLTVTLDDEATNSLPLAGALVSGTFKPTELNTNLTFDFPPPAPPGTSNSVCSLSMFKNLNPDGTWNLFVVDDASGDSGSISGGWSLNVSVVVPLEITVVEPNAIVSWPAVAQNSQLQFTTSLSEPVSWTNVLGSPSQVVDRLIVTNSISSQSVFYRLIKP